MKKYKVGYTQGVYDMFHVGHLNILKNAKEYCDYLIVGINSDDLVMAYKNKKTVIPDFERAEIVRNIKCVDECIIVSTLDKEEILNILFFDAIFIGDDWKGNQRWNDTEEKLGKKGVDVVYLPHTEGISSTILREVKNNKIDE